MSQIEKLRPEKGEHLRSVYATMWRKVDEETAGIRLVGGSWRANQL
jgi:hypothetical protein